MDQMDVLKGKPTTLFSKTVTQMHSMYLYEIEHPEEYTEWFEVIRHAGQNDIIKIHINSPGGVLTSATQLMRCLQETEATVICSVEGECMSAATMIFLQADIVEISDHSMFMFHNYSGGAFGKGGEMMDQLQYERMWSEKMLRTVYEDFLTEEEIEMMLNNKDIWMTGEEVTERMEQKAEKLKIKLSNENTETD